MGAADEAYRAAERLIDEAARTGAAELSLNREETRALAQLPEGIGRLDGLRVLDLKDTNLTDLAPLAGLTGLTRLRLHGTGVTDLAPLAGLTGLTELRLNGTWVTDLAPVARLTGLTTLWLDGTRVTDLAPLAGLTGLTELRLDGTAVTDLAPLAGLTALTWLSLDRTGVTDLAPVAGLTGLTALWLVGTRVADLSPLAGLTGLTALGLGGTRVTDLAPLAGLTALTTLGLVGTGVTDLAPLAGLTRLTALGLGGTGVTDLAPLAGLTGLTTLRLGGTGLTDLAPLAGLTGLTALGLDGTGVTDLAPLAGLTGLTALVLDRTGVTDLRPLRTLTRLAEAPSDDGLTFAGCAAAQADPRIAAIAAIEKPAERARALFDLIDTGWAPPVPEGDPLFPVAVEDGRLEVTASLPTEAERDERLKRLLHARLRETACAVAALSNRFPRLAARARVLRDLLDRPFEDVDLLCVHLEVESLAAMERAGREEEGGEAFTPEAQVALADLMQAGPALTLDHPDVETLMERTRRFRAEAEPPEHQAAQDAMSRALAGDAAAVGDNLRALEVRVAAPDTPAAAVAQRGVNRSVLVKLGALAVVGNWALERVAGGVFDAHAMPPILDFIAVNWPVLVNAAATYGPGFLHWFTATVGPIPEVRARWPDWRAPR
jgi:Leucine-rich repeat (LRR) protein